MRRDRERVVVRATARAAQAAIRRLSRALAALERLDGLDALGTFRVRPGEEEASYGSDLLDFVRVAREGYAESTVEVAVYAIVGENTQSPQGAERREQDDEHGDGRGSPGRDVRLGEAGRAVQAR